MVRPKEDILSIPRTDQQFEPNQYTEITAINLGLPQYKGENKSLGFKTDEEIAATDQEGGGERLLQKWSETWGETELGEIDLDGNHNTEWDQFAVNEKLFGLKSTYEEDYEKLYTTPLDKNSTFYKERVEKAKKLASDIKKIPTRNPHRMEERDAIEPVTEGVSEEDRYSAVIREPTPAKYIIPAQRNQQVKQPPPKQAPTKQPKPQSLKPTISQPQPTKPTSPTKQTPTQKVAPTNQDSTQTETPSNQSASQTVAPITQVSTQTETPSNQSSTQTKNSTESSSQNSGTTNQSTTTSDQKKLSPPPFTLTANAREFTPSFLLKSQIQSTPKEETKSPQSTTDQPLLKDFNPNAKEFKPGSFIIATLKSQLPQSQDPIQNPSPSHYPPYQPEPPIHPPLWTPHDHVPSYPVYQPPPRYTGNVGYEAPLGGYEGYGGGYDGYGGGYGGHPYNPYQRTTYGGSTYYPPQYPYEDGQE